MQQRIAISGVGMVSPLGIGTQTQLLDKMSINQAISPWYSKDNPDKPLGLTASVANFKPKEFLPRKGLRNLNNAINFARIATNFALEDAGLVWENLEPSRIGIVLGTNQACADHMFRFDRDALEGFVDPLHFPNTGISSPACQVSVFGGLHGLTSTFSSGHGASLDALQFSMTSLMRGDVDVVIAGGVEALCPDLQKRLLECSLYWQQNPSEEHSWPGPFQADHDSGIVGEGAVCFVLEREASVASRGGRGLAVITGYATGFDPCARQSGKPSITAMTELIEEAIARAGLEPQAMDAVFSGACGQVAHDRAESRGLSQVFGVKGIPVVASAAQIGDTNGATGAFLAANAIASLRTQHLQGFAPDGASELDLVHGSRTTAIHNSLLTAFGTMGDRTAMVLQSPN